MPCAPLRPRTIAKLDPVGRIERSRVQILREGRRFDCKIVTCKTAASLWKHSRFAAQLHNIKTFGMSIAEWLAALGVARMLHRCALGSRAENTRSPSRGQPPTDRRNHEQNISHRTHRSSGHRHRRLRVGPRRRPRSGAQARRSVQRQSGRRRLLLSESASRCRQRHVHPGTRQRFVLQAQLPPRKPRKKPRKPRRSPGCQHAESKLLTDVRFLARALGLAPENTNHQTEHQPRHPRRTPAPVTPAPVTRTAASRPSTLKLAPNGKMISSALSPSEDEDEAKSTEFARSGFVSGARGLS